jgi:spermidine synthase
VEADLNTEQETRAPAPSVLPVAVQIPTEATPAERAAQRQSARAAADEATEKRILHANASVIYRYTPHAIITISSACMMVVELVAGRLIARHMGSSLYTWTSIIGVVLAGMSIGNYIGGRMADRHRPERFLGWLFMAASAACLSTLFLNNLFDSRAPLAAVPFAPRVFLSVLAIFLLPALILGTINPATAKMALDRSRAVGATIGSVYAWGAVGSIAGTLGTGFWLIAALGTKGVVLLITVGLGVIGLILGPRRIAHLVWVLLLAGVFLYSTSASGAGRSLGYELGIREGFQSASGAWYDFAFARDSKYQFVKAYTKTDKRTGRELAVLALDYLIHGYVDPKDPSHLEYEYERIYRDVARRFVGHRKKVSGLFLGGGSYTFPRWMQQEWPGARALVAEIDPLVVECNFAALGLPRSTTIESDCRDARNVVDDLPRTTRFDLIFGDAFSDLSIPFHLTTREFYQKLSDHLGPGGALLQNIIDNYDSALMLGSTYVTLKKIFKHVYVFSTDRGGRFGGRETFVVASSQDAIDVADWRAGHEGAFQGSVLGPEVLAELEKKCNHRVLTDDDAPVENLLAPVVRARK